MKSSALYPLYTVSVAASASMPSRVLAMASAGKQPLGVDGVGDLGLMAEMKEKATDEFKLQKTNKLN